MVPARFPGLPSGMQINCRKDPLTLGGFVTSARDVQMAGNEVGFLVRIVAKWRVAITSLVPVGFEDEAGFHYGAKAGHGFF